MTTSDAKTTKSPRRVRMPDPPQREPDEMTSYDHLHKSGNSHHLAQYLGNPETILVEAERWIIAYPTDDRTRARRPDLLIAFDVDPAAYEASNGYIVSEQGKPPDFVLEIASESTADTDTGAKRDDYAALGIREYWRFDETGEFHGTGLAGDRLVDGAYQLIPIEQLGDGRLQGYSAVLRLNLRWENGRLGWYDPDTDLHIPTYDYQRTRADDERVRADRAETELRAEREARAAAEARIRELQRQLERRNS